MAYHLESPGEWPSGVYQIAVTDPVLGGSDGPPNVMARALVNRSLYQRLRNVTPWSADLAAAYGYPAGACVRHGVTTWRAIVDNNVAPGTDPLKWERWGFSEAELAAYLRSGLLSPVNCPVTGPVAAPSAASSYVLWKSEAYSEYWGWKGDAWKVVADRWSTASYIASAGLAANTQTAITSLSTQRDGRAVLRGIFSALNAGAVTEATSHIRRVRAGVTTLLAESVSSAITTASGQYVHARPYTVTDVQAGDTYYLLGLTSAAVSAHSVNQNSIHLEYLR